MAVFDAAFKETNDLSDFAEAVIISGPRKGEFILVNGDSIMSAASVEALLEQLMAAADTLGKTVDAQAAEINHLQNEADKLRRDLNGTSERLRQAEVGRDAEKPEALRIQKEWDRELAKPILPHFTLGSGSDKKKGN